MSCQENSERAESASSGFPATGLVGSWGLPWALAFGGPLCLTQEPVLRLAANPYNATDWEYVQTVSSGTRATLKVSKDNVVFGVRAVDAAGQRSLSVVPEPER